MEWRYYYWTNWLRQYYLGCSIWIGHFRWKGIKISKEHWQYQMLARMCSKNSHSLLEGTQKSTDTLENNLAVSYKTKHILTIQSRNCTAWCFLKEVENLHMDIYRNFIYNYQDLEETKMDFSRWMHKWIVVYPVNGILFSTKNEWTIKLLRDIEEY